MEIAVAEAIASGTRDQAQQDAQNDLRELRKQAVEAGRERSRKLIKVSNINKATSVARYNPAGRLLRDWYVHVYLNSLRANVGEPSVVIDAQQIEDLAGLVHRVRPASEPLQALQAVGAVRNLAVDDANQAAATIVERLQSIGAERAVRHAPDERFNGDAVRVHVTRHWYLRCFSAHVEVATRSQQPLTGVTYVEQDLVARTLATGEIRPIIGRDGIPVVTMHNTRMNAVDRALANGETGVVPPTVVSETQRDTFDTLRRQVKSTWSDLTIDRRAQWLRLAEAEPMRTGERWSDLSGGQQSKIIRNYLHAHRRDLLDLSPDRALIKAEPASASRRMFNHRQILQAGSDSTSSEVQHLRSAPFDAHPSISRESSRGAAFR